MTKLAVSCLPAALVAGCQNESKLVGRRLATSKRASRSSRKQNAKYAEALDFLQKVYGQQKQQQQAAGREEPDPTRVFAVDIAHEHQGRPCRRPATGAPVTIVEAWDFA